MPLPLLDDKPTRDTSCCSNSIRNEPRSATQSAWAGGSDRGFLQGLGHAHGAGDYGCEHETKSHVTGRLLYAINKSNAQDEGLTVVIVGPF